MAERFFGEADDAHDALNGLPLTPAGIWRALKGDLPSLPQAPLAVWTATFASLAAVATLLPRFAQPQSYHDFADKRTCSVFGILAIPHCGDVLTNLPFAGVAAIALLGLKTVQFGRNVRSPEELFILRTFFAAVGSVCIGSGIYHLAPTHTTLLGDRLTMTLAYGALLPLTLAERWSPRTGAAAWGPVVALCVASAAYWIASEWLGTGNIVPYAIVQGAVMLGWPALMLARSSSYDSTAQLWAAFACAVACKGIEVFDRPVFALTGHILSGHSVHHLLGAAAAWFVWTHVRDRQIREDSVPIAKQATDDAVSEPAPLSGSDSDGKMQQHAKRSSDQLTGSGGARQRKGGRSSQRAGVGVELSAASAAAASASSPIAYVLGATS